MIPPSPEAANLGRYAASPISFYTGTPQISVPLLEVDAGPLKLPLTLSYNASGNRVEDMASWVGLGWALNAGGVITRAVRGAADDQQPSGPNLSFINFFDVTRNYNYDQFQQAPYDILQPNSYTSLLINAAKGCADVQPDIFYFNFNGYTGQFTFDWNQQLILSSNRDITITPTYVNNIISSWQVITEDGSIYTFSAAENTTNRPKNYNVANCTPVQGRRFTSSWFLSSVTDVNREHRLSFFYDAYLLDHGLRMTDAIEIGIGDCADITDAGVNHSSQSRSSIEGLRLRRVCASTGADTTASIDLVPTVASRTDTVGMGRHSTNLKALDHVILRDGMGREVQTAFLTYAPNNPTGRLTLSQVQMGRLNGSKLPGHVFTYNTANALPASTQSRAQDHWGFYNGAVANDGYQSMVPGCSLRGFNGRIIQVSGANRGVSPTMVQAGILQKIVYPTGGSTTYEYELNDYGYVNDLAVRNDTSIAITVRKDISAGGGEPVPRLGACFYKTRTFTLVTAVSRATISWDVFNPKEFGSRRPSVKMEGPSGTIILQTAGVNVPKKDQTIRSLPPGRYTLTAHVCAPFDTLDYADGEQGHGLSSAEIAVDYDSVTTQVTLKKVASGLRVRRIRDYASAADSLYTEKTFAYKENEPQGSSGCIYGEPHYEYRTQYTWSKPNPVPFQAPILTQCDYWLRLDRNRISLGTTQGSLIGYREVTVTNQLRHQPYSRSKYRFSSPVEYPDFILDQLPFPPVESYSYQTGQLLEQIDYRNENNKWSPVKKTVNSYQFYEKQTLGLAVANPNAVTVGAYTAGAVTQANMLRETYLTILGHIQTASTCDTLYDTSGTLGWSG